MLGFHGCDESVQNKLVNSPNDVNISKQAYDWLGHGFYIWENNFERAYQWAFEKKKRGVIENPAVVGVVYQLDHCLDFTDSLFINSLEGCFLLIKEDPLTFNGDSAKNIYYYSLLMIQKLY